MKEHDDDNLPVPFVLDSQLGPFRYTGVTELEFYMPSQLGRGEMPPPSEVVPFGNSIVSDRQYVSIHTADGVQLHQFLPEDMQSLFWSRESREVSRCEIVAESPFSSNEQLDIIPWLHWVSVWDETGEILLWTGPIQKLAANKHKVTISSLDVSALFSRTRCPISKAWDVADPAEIARELWDQMIDLHGLMIRPIVATDPYGSKFDFKCLSDAVMLDSTMDDLVQKGLHWSVVSGTPILGPASRRPVAALGEDDFLGAAEGLTLVRDGSKTFNDVLLRGADAISQARVPLGGLNLQTIVNVDNMFGVSNVDRATLQYARYSATIRDTVDTANGSVLHPQSPITIDRMIPSVRITVAAYGLLLPTELKRVEVSVAQGQAQVSVSLESVDDDLPELIDVQRGIPTTGYDT